MGKFDVKITVIPNGLEKYIAFTLMNSSLDALVKNMSDNDFKHLFEEFSGEFLKLVKQKGVYPYKYMENFKRFSEDKLPDRCIFFNSLKDECISEKDYRNANNVWNVFKINTVGDYHDLNLKTDVLLLSEKIIKHFLDYYGLGLMDKIRIMDLDYYGLSWDAMLQVTDIQLELISDIGMHLFIEKGMRGGISYIAKRRSKANNEYMECYDSGKESKYITYLDANILYGWAMSQYLRYSEFR